MCGEREGGDGGRQGGAVVIVIPYNWCLEERAGNAAFLSAGKLYWAKDARFVLW